MADQIAKPKSQMPNPKPHPPNASMIKNESTDAVDNGSPCTQQI